MKINTNSDTCMSSQRNIINITEKKPQIYTNKYLYDIFSNVICYFNI